ncbi:MAG: pilus assembly protein PilM, partial [Opitutae bacterium]|nr:pilus assembly protein PilM [Opitutae bacterium]
MPLSRVVVLDCGASRVALGTFTRTGSGRLKIEDYAAEHFFIEPGRDEAWLDAVRAALQTLRPRWKSGGPVLLTLPGHLALTKHLKTPRVEAAQRAKIIKFEAQQNIPYALHEVVWDSVVGGDTGIDLEVLLAAAKLDLVEALCAAVEAAGFTPRLLLPSPLATLAGFRLAQPRESRPVIVLNLGARSSTLLYAEPARFYVRTLSLGGNNVSQQIGEDQDCEILEAESLKLGGRNASLTAHATEGLAARLAQEITRSVLHFRRQSGAENPAKVFLTGGTARLPGLGEALAGKLNVPVDRLDALGAVDIAPRAGKTELADDALAATDLIGAAATQLVPQQAAVNLLPSRLRTREGLRRRQPWLVAAAVLALAAPAPVIWHFEQLASLALAKTAAIEEALAPVRERDARNRANLRKLETARELALQLH